MESKTIGNDEEIQRIDKANESKSDSHPLFFRGRRYSSERRQWCAISTYRMSLQCVVAGDRKLILLPISKPNSKSLVHRVSFCSIQSLEKYLIFMDINLFSGSIVNGGCVWSHTRFATSEIIHWNDYLFVAYFRINDVQHECFRFPRIKAHLMRCPKQFVRKFQMDICSMIISAIRMAFTRSIRTCEEHAMRIIWKFNVISNKNRRHVQINW